MMEKWEGGYVDWRSKPAYKNRHGGMLAASFVLVCEVLENLAFLANASNLVLFCVKYLKLAPAVAANTVTNFMGTAFLLALLGGFLSDAFLTTYQTYLISALIEFAGLVVLTVQAQLNAAKGTAAAASGSSSQLAVFFTGLYLVALGVGGIKGSLPSHGAHQFDEEDVSGRKRRSTFFNYFVFCLATGALIAVTFVIWIEDNKGWQWGLVVCTLAILLSIPIFLSGSRYYRNKIPTGSPLTVIGKVIVASVLNRPAGSRAVDQAPAPISPDHHDQKVVDREVLIADHESQKYNHKEVELSKSLRFFNRASSRTPFRPALSCSNGDVEDVKTILRILPIFACTIILNCCLAQLSTFSVQQAASMNTSLRGFVVPPASLPVFPVVFMMILAPVYDQIIIPFARRVNGTETGISHLKRIGIGLLLSIAAMATAALVEIRRKKVAEDSGMLDAVGSPLPVTFLWIAIQYLFLGSADLFTLAGLLEFFFAEAPERMKSIATSLSWASLAIGYYLSSVLVQIVNSVSGSGAGGKPWLKCSNLNRCHLERFYWMMCALSAVNFLHYLLWAVTYKYRSKV